MEQQKNGMATAGFILALVTLVFGWVPVLGWITWVLAVVFSAIGIAKAKKLGGKGKGLAVAGLIISLAGVVLKFIIGAAIIAALGIGAASVF